jgi:hypothetical protein
MIHRVQGSHFMPRASVRNIMICHQQKIHLQPESYGELEAAASSICCLWYIPLNPYSGIFRNMAGREVGLELFVGWFGGQGVYWWFPVLKNENIVTSNRLLSRLSWLI